MPEQTLPPIAVTVPQGVNDLHRWKALVEQWIEQGKMPGEIEGLIAVAQDHYRKCLRWN
jgi:hypothetical protein